MFVRVGACRAAFRCGSRRSVSVSVRAVSIRALPEFRVMRAGPVRVKGVRAAGAGRVPYIPALLKPIKTLLKPY